MVGFFLEEFNKIQSTLNGDFKIFVLSSSVNSDDIEKAKDNINITNYFAKPLMIEGILALKDSYT